MSVTTKQKEMVSLHQLYLWGKPNNLSASACEKVIKDNEKTLNGIYEENQALKNTNVPTPRLR